MSDFISYVGHPAIHDSKIVSVQHEAPDAQIILAGTDGCQLTVTFQGVESVKAHQAEGMMVYALSEMQAPASYRRFVFANWDEEDHASLEITAQDFSIAVEEA